MTTRSDSRRCSPAQPAVLTTMSSGECDDSEYEDIKEFFTTSEWKELTSDDKRCHRKSKNNYEAIRRCGWTTKPPFFMCRKLPPEQQDETSGEGAARPSLLDHAEVRGRLPAPSPDQPREGANHGTRTSGPKILGLSTPGLSSPGLSTRGLNTPGLSTPGLSSPGVSSPEVRSPGLSSPGVSSPGLGTLGLSSPGLSTPGLRAPHATKRAVSRKTPEPELHDDEFLCSEPEPRTTAAPCYPKRAVRHKPHKEPEPRNDDLLAAAVPPPAGAAGARGGQAQGGEAPHRCATCGAAFRRAALLRAHMRTHAADELDSGKSRGVSSAKSADLRRLDVTRRGAAPGANTSEHKNPQTRTSAAPRVPKRAVSRKARKDPTLQDASLSVAKPPHAGSAAAGARGEQAQGGQDRGLEDAAGKASHRCVTCGAAFRRAALLRAHMPTHAADGLNSCAHCGVTSAGSTGLRGHAGTHTGERPYSCQTCGKRFSQSATLRANTRTHTGAAPAAGTSRRQTHEPRTFRLKTHEPRTPEPRTSRLKTHEPRTSATPSFTKRTVTWKKHKQPKPHDNALLSAAKSPPAGAAGARGHQARDGGDHGLQDAAAEAPHRCATCGAVFRRAALLRAHMRSHAADKVDSGEHSGVSSEGSADLRRLDGTRTGAAAGARTSRLKAHQPRTPESRTPATSRLPKRAVNSSPLKEAEPQDDAYLCDSEPPTGEGAGARGEGAQDGEDRGQQDAAVEAHRHCSPASADHRKLAGTRTVDRPYNCPICGKSFPQSCNVSRHVRTHTGQKPYECHTCGKGFSRSDNLCKHVRTHTGEKPYECQTCGKEFKLSAHLHKHMRTHAEEKPYECQTCGKGFRDSTKLRVHKRTHTGEKPYECQTCSHRFARSSYLRVHKRTHTGDRPYKCLTCSKGFTRMTGLRSHVRTHTGEKPYECQTCGKRFTEDSTLRLHRRTHTGQKPYECQTCSHRFARSSNLRVHMTTHTGEKPYVCQTCSHRFARSSYLRVHKRTHTGDRPYKCLTCSKGFTRMTGLRSHVRTHTGEKPYECQTCGKRFTEDSTLRLHRRTHTGHKPYECQTCSHRFARSSNLRVHMRTHRGEKPYVCQTCGRGFSRNSAWRRHTKICRFILTGTENVREHINETLPP